VTLSSTHPFPNLAYGPEEAFGVHHLAIAGDTVVGEMSAPSSPGHVGVLVDDVLGHAILAARPADHWQVSTEIAIDFVGNTRWTGVGPVSAVGWLVDATESGGLALGKVQDTAGRVLAHCRQRGRFVPMFGELVPPVHSASVTDADTAALLGLRMRDEVTVEMPVIRRLSNPLGNLHGGVALTVSDWLASRRMPERVTASIHIAYVRPIQGGSTPRFAVDHIHQGRTLAISRVVSSNAAGKPCTIATITHH
jgi:uncharacterized protein (TIGR00369 family)